MVITVMPVITVEPVTTPGRSKGGASTAMTVMTVMTGMTGMTGMTVMTVGSEEGRHHRTAPHRVSSGRACLGACPSRPRHRGTGVTRARAAALLLLIVGGVVVVAAAAVVVFVVAVAAVVVVVVVVVVV